MKELFEQNIKTLDRHSSKGNQLKWQDGDTWYKADYTGYEGLAEYVVSHLLEKTSLKSEEFVTYQLEQIKYKETTLRGAKSKNFLKPGWQMITLERLYKNFSGKSLYKAVWSIPDEEERLQFLVGEVTRITGLREFGEYISKLMTIDAFFLNDDRHMHNIALLKNEANEYKLCPIFDNGASLLSDTRLEYPLGADVYKLIDSAKAKTFSQSFDNQLDIAEQLYGTHVKLQFTAKDAKNIVATAEGYSKEEKDRVITVLRNQIRKYQYLFRK